MKSVGEAMSIGRTFKEALQKALRSLEQGRAGLGADGKDVLVVRELNDKQKAEWRRKVIDKLKMPKPENVFFIRYAFQLGCSVEEIYKVTKIDPWFLQNIKQLVDFEEELVSYAG
jgi:carbamoyl-phosphate synthase large subunit